MVQPYYLIVSYDGTDYYGWQEQKREQTVAGTMQDRFARTFHQDIKVVGASRTDAGLHALHQVARFHTDIDVTPEHMARVWNASLPKDIHIRELDVSPSGFHPQHNIAEKRYDYYICPRRPFPFVARYCWWPRYRFDPDLLERALQVFIGTHDFRSFCAGEYTGNETVCTMSRIQVSALWCISSARDRKSVFTAYGSSHGRCCGRCCMSACYIC